MVNIDKIGKQFEELSRNDEAMKEFAGADTISDRVVVLARYGIVVTEEELEAIEKILEDETVKELFGGNVELSEESLEKVSGGFILLGAGIVTGLTVGGLGATYGVYKLKEKLEGLKGSISFGY